MTGPTKFDYYEASVQEPSAETDFFDFVYKEKFGRLPSVMREDFCGTAAICRDWVGRRTTNVSIGLDLDKSTIREAKRRNTLLPAAAQGRVHMHEANVLTPPAHPKADIICALNFSYWIFKQREMLRTYFERARANLKPDGLFILDFFGGSDCHKEIVERHAKRVPAVKATATTPSRPSQRFTYIWKQATFNPITHDMRCTISFEVPQIGPGGKLGKPKLLADAFTYVWRLYSMPEIIDLLRESGFSDVAPYLEREDEKGVGTGKYRRCSKQDADRCFLAYLVAKP